MVCSRALFGFLVLAACQRVDAPAGAGPSAATERPTASGTAAVALPVLVVDDEHLALRDGGIAYSVAAGPGLVIDRGNYRFEPTAFGKEPTAVHLMHGADEYYRADWDGRRQLRLDAVSLSPVRGKGPFAGFGAGEKYIIAVGAEGEGSADGAMKFAPMWIANVEAK